MDEETIRLLGEGLYEAERVQKPRSPLTEQFATADIGDAYRIQEEYARRRLADGALLVGRKIGATSQAIQDLFGIDTPDYGQIFDDMTVENGGDITIDQLIQPMVEPEIAFILEHALEGPGVSAGDVLAATSAVAPCLEIIDSRIDDWRITIVDTVADNGSSARCVFGPAIPLDGRDLAVERVSLLRDGEELAAATGAAVLGHPAASVAWLANALAVHGQRLEPGHWILSGSFTTAIRAARGERYEAVFESLGSVSCRFI